MRKKLVPRDWRGTWVIAVAICASVAALGAEKAPEVMPYCQSPQQLSPMQLVGGTYVNKASPVVWNGKDYAMAWTDYATDTLYFRRFFADGTPASAPWALFPGDGWEAPALVWDGTGYGVAWVNHNGSVYVTYFARLDAMGHAIGSAVQVSTYGGTPTANALVPALAWSGSGYAVAWEDYRSGTRIYATLLDASGNVTYHDTVLQSATNAQWTPSIAWVPGAGRYMVAWQDRRSVTKYEIAGANLTPGNYLSSIGIMATGSGDSWDPSLAASPNGIGMAWADNRDGNYETYFALFSNSGAKMTTDQRLTTNSSLDLYPACAWTGAEYGVFWEQGSTGSYNLWFQRVSAAGAATGSGVQVAYAPNTEHPKAAFAQHGYLVTGTDTSWANYAIPLGCNYAYSPPCPSNPMAYGVTGTTATISWLPSYDTSTDIAYYQVYRNNSAIAKTSDTFYADSGLSLNTAYNYAIVAVNAAQLPSTGCGTGASLFVKTNATLLLTVNKNSPDAALTWTDSSGQTLPTYNIFRGTSAQVMQQVGSSSTGTYSHANALMDNNLYFYTVDDPGW